MACLSDGSSVYLPSVLSGTLPLELQNKTDEPNSFDFFSPAYRLERVLPLYAMGTPNPDSVDNSGGAKLEAENEPILSSFLYSSVLSHDCLEQALAFVLANRLQNPTLLATQLTDIFCHVMMHDKGNQRSIRLDVQAFKYWDPACLSYCSSLLYMKSHFLLILGTFLLTFYVMLPLGYHALQVHRVAHALWGQGRQVLSSALQSRVSEVFGVDIHPAAKIGEGILLDHGTGVVIGETAIIGNRVSLMHGVTLGGSGKEIGHRHPKIGDGALIGACATILGNIRIGKRAMIAAGSPVLKEVPPHRCYKRLFQAHSR